MYAVEVRYGCTLWIYALDIRYEYTLWTYAVNVRCGCALWMQNSQLNTLETVACEISTLVDRYCFLQLTLMKGNRLQFILPGKAVRHNSCLRNRRHSFSMGVGGDTGEGRAVPIPCV